MSLASKLEVLEGRLILTVSFLAIQKELKLMIVLLEAVISNVFASGDEKVAEPDSTVAPCGWARTADTKNKLIHKRNTKYFQDTLQNFLNPILFFLLNICILTSFVLFLMFYLFLFIVYMIFL